ncbi:MAG: hypothetical protein R2856_00505 [Caldilineaceae bacterium]
MPSPPPPTTAASCRTSKAPRLSSKAGWVDSNGDGIREKDGISEPCYYVTSTNSVRQKHQALVKQWWEEIGIATELRNVDAAVFFGGDPSSPDTLGKFCSDVQMFTNGNDTSIRRTTCRAGCATMVRISVAGANNWLGNNVERWCSEDYDALFAQYAASTDPAERQELAKAMNDMLVQNYVMLPQVYRGSVSAHHNTLGGVWMNGWDTEEWNIEDWYRIDD